MKVLLRFFYLAAFIGVAGSAALALDRALHPSLSAVLLRAVIMACVLGAAGLVHRKAWAVSLLLLPLGGYLLLRTTLPPGPTVEGIGGIYRFYVNALATGGDQYAARFFPLDLAAAPELRLLLATAVYCLMGAASFLALSLRRAVAGLTLVLLLLGYSFTVDNVSRILALAVAFFVLAACVLVLSRSLERRQYRVRDAVPGVLIGGAGVALALVLLGAAPSAAAQPWRDWRAWNPFHQAGRAYSFNWLQNYPQLLDPANSMVIMSVQSPKPSYWRANALDEFTGEAWVSSQTFLQDLERTAQATGYLYSIPAASPAPAGKTVTERFRVRSAYTNYFFTGGDPRSLLLDQDVVVRTNEMRSLHVANALGPALDYTLQAVIPDIAPKSLVGSERLYSSKLDDFLQLPFPRISQLDGADKDAAWQDALADLSPGGDQWTGLYRLDQMIVGEATDPYEVALRLERYLRQNYQYSLKPPSSEYPSPYAAFLFDHKTGYCQHFAGSMALLLRFNGIPARVAVGFTQGEPQGSNVYSVSTTNAHAWVEAYFPKAGWVAFDPTPGRSLPTAGGSSTSPGFTDPFTAGATGPTTATTEAKPDLVPRRPTDRPESATQSRSAGWLRIAAWPLGLVALLIVWPLGRSLWRGRGLHHGDLTDRFAASLQLLRGSLAAYGIHATSSTTLEELLESIDHHLGSHCDPAVAARAGAILFGGRAALPEDVAAAEDLRLEVESALRKRHGWIRTALVWYGLPPAKRRGAGPADRQRAPRLQPPLSPAAGRRAAR